MSARAFRQGLVCALLLIVVQGQAVAQLSRAAADAEVDEYAVPAVSDPLEPFNRAIFRFNDRVYNFVLWPVSRGYQRVVPSPVRRGLTNFFDNLKFPVRFVSSALQGKVGRAGRETEKFLVNTTAGIGGLFRVSDSIPALVSIPAEDLGQTFGVWGVGSGPYLVLPLLGPSSVRDAVGYVGGTFLDPVNWAGARHTIKGYTKPWSYGLDGLDFINFSPDLFRAYDAFRQSALDPYVSVRNGYLQYRAAATKQ